MERGEVGTLLLASFLTGLPLDCWAHSRCLRLACFPNKKRDNRRGHEWFDLHTLHNTRVVSLTDWIDDDCSVQSFTTSAARTAPGYAGLVSEIGVAVMKDLHSVQSSPDVLPSATRRSVKRHNAMSRASLKMSIG